MTRRVVLTWLVLLAVSVSHAAEGPLATGNRFDAQLDLPMTATWANVSFREAIASLIDARQMAVLVDRRIDADKPFELTLKADPLRLALQKIAERKQTGMAILRPVIYFGPTSTADKLRTIAALRREEITKLPAEAKRRLLLSKPGGWPKLAEPRALVKSLADEARVKVTNLDTIPHDLWPAVRMPTISWSDRLTLVLVQFDLTFRVSEQGGTLELVAIPDEVSLERRYPGGELPQQRLAKLRQRVPAAELVLDEDQSERRGASPTWIVVRGRAEDHDEIATLLSGKQVRTNTVKRGSDRYKLTVERLPLDKVFAQLATMLKLEVSFDQKAIEAAEISTSQLITFSVTDATLEELLAAALKDTALTYDLHANKLKIIPAD